MLGVEGADPLFGDAAGRADDAEAIGRGLAEQLIQAHPAWPGEEQG